MLPSHLKSMGLVDVLEFHQPRHLLRHLQRSIQPPSKARMRGIDRRDLGARTNNKEKELGRREAVG